jgi:hypothetical protein
MPRRLLVLMIALAVGVGAVSLVALLSGLDEARLAASGPRRDLAVSELAQSRGFIGTFGCVRHDLAVGVTASQRVYRLGERLPAAEELVRVFTPLAAPADCDEDRAPKNIYALVEDDDSLGTTITHSYRVDVPPPPVPAMVSGVIGYGSGHLRQARAARVRLKALGLPLGASAPLLVKGKRPGVLWVAVLTALAGVHGLLFCALGFWWVRRRIRRRKATLIDEGDVEGEFFGV